MFNVFTFRELVSPLVVKLLDSTKAEISSDGDILYGTFNNANINKLKKYFLKELSSILNDNKYQWKAGRFRTLILGTCKPTENIAFNFSFENGNKISIPEYLDFWYTTQENIVLDTEKLDIALTETFFTLFSNKNQCLKTFGTESVKMIYLSGFSSNNLWEYIKDNLIPSRSIECIYNSKGFLCDCNDLINTSIHIRKIPECEHELLKSQIF